MQNEVADAVAAKSKINESNNSEFPTAEFLLYLWHKKWWIILCLVLGLGLAYYNHTLKPATYSSKAKVIFIFNDEGSSTGATLTALTEFKGTGYVNLNNELAVLTSPALMDDVVEKLNLTIKYSSSILNFRDNLYTSSPVNVSLYNVPIDSAASFYIKKIDDSHVKAYNFSKSGKLIAGPALRIPINSVVETPVGQVAIIPTENFNSFPEEVLVEKIPLDNVARSMAGGVVAASEDDNNTVVNITYTSTNQQLSTDVLEALIEAYNELWMFEKSKAANNTSDFIRERLVKIESDLSGIDKSIAGKKQGTVINMEDIYTPRSDDKSDMAYELTTKLTMAENARDRIQSAFSTNAFISVSTGSTSLDNMVKDYNTTLTKLKKASDGAGENNPTVREYELQMDQIRAAILQGINSQIADLRLQASRVSSLSSTYRGRSNALPQREAELLPIERQQKVKETLYLYLLQKREENELTKMISVNNTRVIEAPHTMGKIGPKKMSDLAVGALIGLAIPVAILFLLFYFDTKIKSRSDLRLLTIPFLGEIPQNGKKKLKRQASNLLHKDKRKFDDSNIKIFVNKRSRSFMNESFRMLRTNLDFMSGNSDESQCIMCTSYQAGSGKTFITLNLAASLAIKNKKVVVVDADLRHASVSKYAGSPVQGVTSYITGKVADIATVIIKDKKSKLIDIVPVGTIPPNPVEMLLSSKFTEMIAELKKKYDYVLLDCPPGTMLADSKIIGKNVDTTIYVVRARLFPKNAVPELEAAYKAGTYPNMALVLNGIDVKNSYYSNRYGYGKYVSSYFSDVAEGSDDNDSESNKAESTDHNENDDPLTY